MERRVPQFRSTGATIPRLCRRGRGPKGWNGPANHRRRGILWRDARQSLSRDLLSDLRFRAARVVFGATVVFLAGLLGDGGQPTGLKDNLEALQLPIEPFCRSSGAHGPLLNAIFGATVHFAATHAALAVICLVAFAVSVICALNTLKTHGFRWHLALGDGGPRSRLASEPPPSSERAPSRATRSQNCSRVCPSLAAPKSGCGVLSDGETLGRTLDWHSVIGAGAVSLAVSSLVVAAACLAYRYERKDINGAWSDSYVLRQKLNSLLTLFFIASALLVITNVALNSAMGWSGAVLDVISDATSADSKEQPPAAAAANDPASPKAGWRGAGRGQNAGRPGGEGPSRGIRFGQVAEIFDLHFRRHPWLAGADRDLRARALRCHGRHRVGRKMPRVLRHALRRRSAPEPESRA